MLNPEGTASSCGDTRERVCPLHLAVPIHRVQRGLQAVHPGESEPVPPPAVRKREEVLTRRRLPDRRRDLRTPRSRDSHAPYAPQRIDHDDVPAARSGQVRNDSDLRRMPIHCAVLLVGTRPQPPDDVQPAVQEDEGPLVVGQRDPRMLRNRTGKGIEENQPRPGFSNVGRNRGTRHQVESVQLGAPVWPVLKYEHRSALSGGKRYRLCSLVGDLGLSRVAGRPAGQAHLSRSLPDILGALSRRNGPPQGALQTRVSPPRRPRGRGR